MADTINVLVMGACLLHGPLNPLARTGGRFRYANYGPVPGTYTFGEMFQAVALLRGERDVPQEIRPLCNMRPNFRPVARSADFSDVDAVLLEPSSPIDISFRGCYLNRTLIGQLVTGPVTEVSREARKHANLWLRTGIIGLNEEARAEAAKELVKFIPHDMEGADLARAVILEARSSKSDVYDSFRRLQELINRPMGIIVYIFQYFADGRAVSWPLGFHEEVRQAAERLGMPKFEPQTIVNQYGVTAALRDDLRHYNDEFLSVIGEAVVDFAFSVRDKSRALAA